MKKILYMPLLILSIMAVENAIAKVYIVPPLSSTSSHVPIISDKQMESCVIIYNKLIDQSEKPSRHNFLVNYFNENCAGKQSESAAKAARELSRR
jgi:hypothetical protein